MQPENAKYLDRARAEADKFAELFRDSTPTREDLLTHLPFIDAAIKESQRLYPTLPALSRLLMEDIDIELRDEYLGAYKDCDEPWFGKGARVGAGGLTPKEEVAGK